MSEANVTLQEHLAAVGRMPPGTGLAFIDALLEQVGEGHRDGVTDGALSPARIVLVDGSRPLVRGVSEAEAATDAGAYLSPQQRDGKPADPRADVYALGVIAYQTLTGAMPFGSGTEAPDDPLTYLPNLTDTVRRTLLIALQHNLTERFADALTMRAALRGDSRVALDTPTIKWAVPEGIPEGDTGAADEYAEKAGLLGEPDETAAIDEGGQP